MGLEPTTFGSHAGWDWHRFNADASFAGADSDFENRVRPWSRFEHPIGQSEVAALRLPAGGTFNHIEIENSVGDVVADSDHDSGGKGVRGSLSQELTVGPAPTPVDLRYVAVELGVSRGF